MAIFDHHHPWAFTFGILGNIVSILVYLAPLPTFVKIYKARSTMGFDSLPYVVALFSAMLWMYYALLKTNAILLISINTFGCIIETIYICIFLFYASKKAKTHAAMLLGLMNVGLFWGMFTLTFLKFEGPLRIHIVGWICVVVTVSVFIAPLSIVFQVVRTRSVEFMPFPLSFSLTLSAVMWFAYGLFQKDICIALPNILGFFLGVLQMLLYGIFRTSKLPQNIEEKKMSDDAIVNVMVFGTNEVNLTNTDKEKIEDVERVAKRDCSLSVEPSQVVNLKE